MELGEPHMIYVSYEVILYQGRTSKIHFSWSNYFQK